MLNTVVLMGRFTHNPEIKTLDDTNIKVTRFCLAVERDLAINGVRKSDFIDCVAWRNTAEFIQKYFNKGSPIIVEGRIETRQYEDKQGNKRKAFEINVRNVNFCAFKKEEAQSTNKEETTTKNENMEDLLSNEDLPF